MADAKTWPSISTFSALPPFSLGPYRFCQSAVRAQTSPSSSSTWQGSMLRASRLLTLLRSVSCAPRVVLNGSFSTPSSSSSFWRNRARAPAVEAFLPSCGPQAVDGGSPEPLIPWSLQWARAAKTCPHRALKRRHAGAMQEAALPAVKETREYTARYSTIHKTVDP